MPKYELPRGYLSASSLNMLLTCPKQFEFRYVQGLVIPPGAALVTGSAMHRTLETYYRDAMTSSQRLTGKQAAELAVASLDEVLGEGENTVSGEERETAIHDLTGLAEVYVDTVAKDIVPLAVEEEVRYTAACGVDILAYLDLRRELPSVNRLDDGVVGEGICDYKITGRKWTIDKLRNSLQFNLYSMATGIGDIEIHNMIKDVKVSKKLPAKPCADGVLDISSNLRLLHHVFDGSQADHLENLIESAARLITSGIFMPCSLDSWCCNETWCGYYSRCRGSEQCNVRYVDMRSAAESSLTARQHAATA